MSEITVQDGVINEYNLNLDATPKSNLNFYFERNIIGNKNSQNINESIQNSASTEDITKFSQK